MTRNARFWFCLLAIWIVLSNVVAAQDAPKPQDEPIHTLHVYANLLQVPTVVLGPYLEQVKPIPENRFSVSIDNGPWFRATHVHLQGDDPISLTILLDANGNATELMPKIGDAIAGLAPLSLHPKDHVSIYALHCSLIRSQDDLPADNADLKTAVANALQSWTNRKENKQEPRCQKPVQLWDALAFVVDKLSKLPGRRVVLVVSDGQDKGSKRSWNEVRAYAQYTGSAVFGMTYPPQYAIGGFRTGSNPAFRRGSTEDLFSGAVSTERRSGVIDQSQVARCNVETIYDDSAGTLHR